MRNELLLPCVLLCHTTMVNTVLASNGLQVSTPIGSFGSNLTMMLQLSTATNKPMTNESLTSNASLILDAINRFPSSIRTSESSSTWTASKTPSSASPASNTTASMSSLTDSAKILSPVLKALQTLASSSSSTATIEPSSSLEPPELLGLNRAFGTPSSSPGSTTAHHLTNGTTTTRPEAILTSKISKKCLEHEEHRVELSITDASNKSGTNTIKHF